MSFHIAIKDNETGEMLCDVDTNAILASIDQDDGTMSSVHTNCDGRTLTATLCGLLNIAQKLKAEHPRLYKMAKKITKKATKTEE